MLSWPGPGPKVGFSKALWATRVPMKVRIFIWQAAADRLPSTINLLKRHRPGNGCCALCGVPENANHILFQCGPAKFLWSCVREGFGFNWNRSSFTDIFSLLKGCHGQQRRLAWRSFSALAWALWTTLNNLAIEGTIPSHPANYIFKWSIYFQLWRPLGKRKDSEASAAILQKVKHLHAVHRGASSS